MLEVREPVVLPLSICLSVRSSCSVRTSSRPSNTGNPLTSASQLCCGRMSVCIFLRHKSCVHVPESDRVFRRGGLQYCRANQPMDRPQSWGTRTRKVKQTEPQPFSQDTFRHSYWLTHKIAPLFIGPFASPTLLLSLRKLWRFGLWTLTLLGKQKAF